MDFIPINLAVEDPLSEAVLRAILHQSNRPYKVGACYCKQGSGYLKKTINGFNNAAKGTPYIVLTDLDRIECPLELIQKWLPSPKHPNLLFRIAVREVEAWLLAHREAFANFLGVQEILIPQDVDAINDPKQTLINLAKKSKKRVLREAIVPQPNSTAKVGRDYNGQLVYFVEHFWQVEVAKSFSPSLERAVNAIAIFEPVLN
ncbi:hypothetical protein [Cylindrospermum sp. FACHB-282]|uniref:hypothetical protein n=1 Tax=Cylindrospermum sp. FACHB-282 TaxID=2692794 RepID=UPI0016889335|nr:hypothetical protein [Cylindrospermum sp. FACHB-282]MBD2388232.1 hypothetical protein [Cylindrospermum sp. FACHB-282]